MYKMCKERLKDIFLKEYIEPRRFRKIRNILFVPPIVTFILFIIMALKNYPFESIFYVLASSCISAFVFFMIEELAIIFSYAVLDGSPKNPSRGMFLRLPLLSSFLVICFLLSVLLGVKGIVIALLIALSGFYFLFPQLGRMHGNIGFLLAGRIYTYLSPSTILFPLILYFMYEAFKNILQSHEIPNLGLSIETEAILFAPFLISLTLLFFWTKERIFNHYGKAIASRRTKKYSRRKEFLEETLEELLRPVPEIDETDVDELYKRVYLIRLETENLDQEIKKVEKEFEFHGSLTWSLITQPFWIVLIFDVIPRLFDLLRNLSNV